MTSRASLRALPPVNARAVLPSLDHPQYVDEDGYELEEDAWLASQQTQDAEDPAGDADDVEDEDTAMHDAEAVIEDTRHQDQEPVLDAAASLVLPLSLTQTRSHHLDQLLPLIFSHPPIPSYNRPRIRHVTKPGLTFPTPPPPALPLPTKEYHGPLQPKETNSPGPHQDGSPNPQDKASLTAHAAKAAKAAARAAKKDADTPAHEIDCIARVTLTVGPISFPDTELWVGRFVEPKTTLPKRIKPTATGERREKRPSLGDSSTAKRARPPATSSIQSSPMPPAPGSVPRQATAAPVRPPSSAPPARTNISPDLIQRVNQAATQHPWLSVIIHKAARGQANKEELAKLGRVVGRLTKGEGVGEGPDEGLTTPIAGPSTTFAPAGLRASGGKASGGGPSSAEPDSDSDDDVDMTGRPQVGGGPIPLTQETPVNADAATAAPLPSGAQTVPHVPSSSLPNQQQSSVPAKADTDDAVPLGKPGIGPPSALVPSKNATNASQPRPPPTAAPLPPRPTYPLPPPFLLVAFKENPTEKFMLPLGSLSYISRVGGDFVTAPKPAPPPPPPSPAPVTPVPAPVPAADTGQSMVPPVSAGTPQPKRTRASMNRAAKSDQPSATVAPKTPPPPTPEPEPVPETDALPKPGRKLPTLPGMPPAPGTVLLSTFIPSTSWNKPDWTVLEKSLPFNNPELHDKPPPIPVPIKAEATDQHGSENSGSTVLPVTPKDKGDSTAPATAAQPRSPATSRSIRQAKLVSTKPVAKAKSSTPSKPRLLNLGSHDFLPSSGPLQPVTIRLSEVEDRVWWRMKSVMNAVDFWDQRHLADVEPDLLSETEVVKPVVQSPSAPVPPVLRFDPTKYPRLRTTLGERKRLRFETLLSRVPPRRFLRTRLSRIPKEIAEAATDRWAPRPYPISTKPLYARSPPPEDEELPVRMPSPEKSKKRRRDEVEEEVMFEMPVSLDQLDERVEEGAMRGMPGRKRGGAPKKVNRRGEVGRTCEGCARNDIKVWRRGPSGRGTLCQVCGDKYTSGTLGELKAPGAAKKKSEADGEGEGDAEAEGDESVKVENTKEAGDAAAGPVSGSPRQAGPEKDALAAAVPAGTSESAPVQDPAVNTSANGPAASVSKEAIRDEVAQTLAPATTLASSGQETPEEGSASASKSTVPPGGGTADRPAAGPSAVDKSDIETDGASAVPKGAPGNEAGAEPVDISALAQDDPGVGDDDDPE